MAPTKKLPVDLKYALYEGSVQEAEVDARFFSNVYREIRGQKAKSLREDFCGTHWLCCEWVKTHPERTALGLDLSPEPIAYGDKVHVAALSAQQRARVRTQLQNVKEPTSERFDLVVAGNFSYFIFKARADLKAYFHAVRQSLHPNGLFIADHFGGPGSSAIGKESRSVKVEKRRFRYVWEAERSNLFTGEALFHIHFEDPRSKEKFPKAFSYDWRLWTVPELIDIAREVGFTSHVIYQDLDGHYKRSRSHADDDDSWLLQIVFIP